mmetsp:Transcript_12873/g.23138  ORF Transcript_12873/g.23138 Transcript_12873/m.23138 type:complete len:138 (+) Transcript_12873:65-478(+)
MAGTDESVVEVVKTSKAAREELARFSAELMKALEVSSSSEVGVRTDPIPHDLWIRLDRVQKLVAAATLARKNVDMKVAAQNAQPVESAIIQRRQQLQQEHRKIDASLVELTTELRSLYTELQIIHNTSLSTTTSKKT